jgi:hypothetical protein
MIEPNDILGESTIELNYPLAKRSIIFISLKDWKGQALRLEVEFLKKLIENYMTIPPPPDINKNKKLMKKLTDINNKLNKMTELGTIFIFLDDRRGGNVYVGQASKLSKITDWNFDEQGWSSFKEVFIFSLKGEAMTMSFRTSIEAKLLKFLMDSKNFKLINEKAESEDKLRYAEFQLNDPNVVRFFQKISAIFRCLDITLLE